MLEKALNRAKEFCKNKSYDEIIDYFQELYKKIQRIEKEENNLSNSRRNFEQKLDDIWILLKDIKK